MRVCQIARKLGLRHEIVHYHIKRYVTNGGFLMANPNRKPRKRNVKMTKEIVDHITDANVLRQWAHLSLDERVIQIEL